jgi:hypothetical protein
MRNWCRFTTPINPTVIPLALTVIPAKAGIQENGSLGWIPAKRLRE